MVPNRPSLFVRRERWFTTTVNRPTLARLVLGVLALGGVCVLAVGILLGGFWSAGAPVGAREGASAAEPAQLGVVEGDTSVSRLGVSDDVGAVVTYAWGGRVVDARTGEPLPGVRVEVLGHPGDWAEVAVTDGEGGFATVVDGSGLLAPGLSPSGAGPAVDVRLRLPGYGTRTVRDWPLPAGGGDQPSVRLDGNDHDDPAYELGLRRVG